MREEGRYSDCILHRGQDASGFMSEYFAGRRVLLIGGAGFDPRASVAARELVATGANLDLRLIREHRPSPSPILSSAAAANLKVFETVVADMVVLDIEVFDTDGAVVGGRRAAAAIGSIPTNEYSDVVVDISALSIGTSFPLIRLLVERFVEVAGLLNLHITVCHDPATDSEIKRTAGDRPGWVHGFGGALGLDSDSAPAKLWMPQLALCCNQELGRIFEFVGPDDTSPVLPFPSRDPKVADRLALAFGEELLGAWDVDVRNIVYADEDDPLDVYRTILRIDDLRRPVFEGCGGSSIIVSPTRSKLTALGALMACVERDLPVAYLEAEAYDMREEATQPHDGYTLMHLWLEGTAYPSDRPALRREA